MIDFPNTKGSIPETIKTKPIKNKNLYLDILPPLKR